MGGYMPRYICCPHTCEMLQEYTGQTDCIACRKEMSNWHIATQLKLNVTDTASAHKLRKARPVAA